MPANSEVFQNPCANFTTATEQGKLIKKKELQIRDFLSIRWKEDVGNDSKWIITVLSVAFIQGKALFFDPVCKKTRRQINKYRKE